eukprot:COSAG01_NODE_13485_length_1579_cov_0.828378_1_plen_155_part_00
MQLVAGSQSASSVLAGHTCAQVPTGAHGVAGLLSASTMPLLTQLTHWLAPAGLYSPTEHRVHAVTTEPPHPLLMKANRPAGHWEQLVAPGWSRVSVMEPTPHTWHAAVGSFVYRPAAHAEHVVPLPTTTPVPLPTSTIEPGGHTAHGIVGEGEY